VNIAEMLGSTEAMLGCTEVMQENIWGMMASTLERRENSLEM